MADLVGPAHGWPWWLAIAAGRCSPAPASACSRDCIITRLGLPSFVVTLAGFLFWQGVMLRILGNGGTFPINDNVINDIASANLSNHRRLDRDARDRRASSARSTWRRDAQAAQRRAGRAAAARDAAQDRRGARWPASALVLLCNTEPRRSSCRSPACPWVVLLVLAVLGVWTFLLGRTKLGRYIYAIGGSAEAARRAGVNLCRDPHDRVRAVLVHGRASPAIVYASRLRSISTSVNGGTLVLYAVAAAVIGGTSLFGGRGKAMHGVLGGIVIAAIDNGMGLRGLHRRRPSTWSPPSCCSPRSSSTRCRIAAASAPPDRLRLGRYGELLSTRSGRLPMPACGDPSYDGGMLGSSSLAEVPVGRRWWHEYLSEAPAGLRPCRSGRYRGGGLRFFGVEFVGWGFVGSGGVGACAGCCGVYGGFFVDEDVGAVGGAG